MPILLFLFGCILLFFSVLIISIPFLSSLDLACVKLLSLYRTNEVNQITQILSILGGMPFVLFIIIICILYMAWYKKYLKVTFCIIGILGSISLAWALKYLVAKPRPPEIFHLVESYGASFPSAHSAYAATLGCLAIYISMKHQRHKIIIFCAFAWMFCMGISRVYLGVHFPSDILSGWGIGLMWISLLYYMLIQYNRTENL